MAMTIDEIYAATKAQLGNTYSVLSSYDASDDIDPTGSIAVNVDEFEHLDHTGCEDYRFQVAVSGFTLADEDKTRATIYAMQNYVLHHLNLEAIKSAVTGCVGAVMGNLGTQSDGDSNEFTVTFDLYVCDAVFSEISSSSAVDAPANSEG